MPKHAIVPDYTGRHRAPEPAAPQATVPAVPCPACQGTGSNMVDLDCQRCWGTGLPDFRVATP